MVFQIAAIICCIVGGFLAWNKQVVYTLLRDYIYPSVNGLADSTQTKTAIENIIKMLSKLISHARQRMNLARCFSILCYERHLFLLCCF